MKQKRPLPDEAASRLFRDGRATTRYFAVIVSLLLIAYLMLMTYGAHTAETDRLKDVVLTFAILMTGFAAFLMADTQMQMLRIQIEQAEAMHIDPDKDRRIVEAVEALRRDLQRRPDPSVINFTLFGGKK